MPLSQRDVEEIITSMDRWAGEAELDARRAETHAQRADVDFVAQVLLLPYIEASAVVGAAELRGDVVRAAKQARDQATEARKAVDQSTKLPPGDQEHRLLQLAVLCARASK